MSRKRRILTARERGAVMALQAAIERLHQLDKQPQLDLFPSRRATRAEWIGIANAALLAVGHG